MDTSKEYIKMCEKAVEVQPSLSPFHMQENSEDVFNDDNDVWYSKFVMGKIFKVWLPRQDQLQDMIKDKNKFVYEISDHEVFPSWVSYPNYSLRFDVNSWEQLWLGFVMKEKYSKIWNGNEWKTGGE